MIPALLALLACSPAPAPAPVPTLAPAPEPATGSLYDLPLDFLDQHGTLTHLSVGKGHPTLVAMFYTSCPQVCPMLIGEFQWLDATLPPAAHDDLRFVLISLDPAHDTPEALAAAAATHGFDERWTLLHGDADTTTEAAALLGVKHKAHADGTMDHTAAITLLDRSGTPIARVDGLGATTDPLKDAILRLATPVHE